MQPIWSPDGSKVAFLRVTRAETTSIIVIPAIGGLERNIGELHSPADALDMRRLLMWLPDSESLIIADEFPAGAPRALFRFSTVTGQRAQITFPPPNSVGDEAPDLSPDGRMLAFAREMNNKNSELFLLPVSAGFVPSGEPTQITHLGRLTTSPLWNASGTELLMASGPQHARSFMRMRPSATARPRPAFSASESCTGNIALSRAKGRVAYSRGNADVNIWKLDLRSSVLQPELVTRSTSLDHLPVFSPDGSRIAFVTNRSGAQQLWVSRVDGSESERLLTFDGEIDMHDWSPDGRLIAFSAPLQGYSQIFTMPAEGGQPKQVTTGHGNYSAPSWSHDGKWLYFAYGQGISKISVTSESESKPVAVIPHGGRPIESPDGQYLFYTLGSEPARLCRLSRDGRDEEVTPLTNSGTFAVSKSGVYYIAPEKPSGQTSVTSTHSILRFLPFSISRPKEIIRIERPLAWGMDVSADERWLLFTQYDRLETDLALIENFR
jgi:Tol biopolymer transport system component